MSDVATAAETLAAAGRLVAREPSLHVVLDGAAALLTEALAADGCLVYRVEDNRELVVVVVHPPRPSAPEQLHLPDGFGVTGRVAADQIPAVLVDDNPRNPLHRSLLGLAEGQLVSRLCVPARTPGAGCSAVVAVHSLTRRDFSRDEVDLAQQVADLVGLRVQLERVGTALGEFESDWERLVAATVNAQEDERRRVAGDLHDGVTQAIASLTFHLSAAGLALEADDTDDAVRQVASARELAELAYAETRSAISGLHSPVLDDLGLAASLASMARGVPNLRVEVDAIDLELPGHIESALFRIAQEAVQNVVKHAEATRALVSLTRHGRSIVLRVTDDGQGFEAPGVLSSAPRGEGTAPQYGLSGMYERVQLLGGQLSVTSTTSTTSTGQHGTTVEVVVPDVLG